MEEEEKTEEKEIIEEVSKKVRKGEKKQVVWILSIMVILILAVFIIYNFTEETKTFEYAGMEFEKVMFGKIPLYRIHISGHGITGSVINMNFNLRNDPRTLEDIRAPMVKLKGEGGIPIYTSVSPDIECEDSSMALMNLGVLLGGTGFDVKSGVSDLDYAEENNMQYVTCENIADRTVIMVSQGETTKIISNGDCYIITFKDCEILRALEKFEIAVLAGFKGRKL